MNGQPTNPRARVLPDMLICRATSLINAFADCRVEDPFQCAWAIGFADGYLCKHPDRAIIIANTERFQGQTNKRPAPK